MIRLHHLRAAQFKQLGDVSLAFPAKGSVLVQGLNEAGKSTLFESVYFALFGKALVTEDNAGKLDDLINYQSPRALVRLAFSTDGATFEVSRGLNRGKPNTATLDIEYAGGKRETVTNLSAVNKRIVEELGFDGEAMLNSCFVEQKKLEKLESMTAQQRRDTLLRLLNLDKLSFLEAQYKPSNADDFQVQQARDRLRLAEIQRDLPAAVARLSAIEAELRRIQAVRLRRQIAELRAAIADEREQQATIRDEVCRLDGDLARVDELKQLRELSKSAGETLLAIRDERADVERLQHELAELRLQAELLPELQTELDRLKALAEELAKLAKRDEQQAERRRELQRLAEAGERLASLETAREERRQALLGLTADLDQARQAVEAAEELQRRARQAGLLRGWLQIREVAFITEQGERELSQLRQHVFDLEQDAAEKGAARQSKQRLGLCLGVATLLSLALMGALAALGIWFGLPALPVVAALAIAWWRTRLEARQSAAIVAQADAAVTAARTDVHRREGEQDLARRTGQDPARLAEIEADMAVIGLPVPGSVADAQERLTELEAGLEGIPAAAPGAERQRLGALEGRRQALEAELAQIETQIAQAGDPSAQQAKLEAAIADEQASIDADRAALPSDVTDPAEARERAAAARAAVDAATEATGKAAQLAATLAERETRLAARGAELEQLWPQLLAARPDTQQHVDACRALWRELGDELAALDEPRLKGESAQLNQDLAASQERCRAAERTIAEAEQALASLGVEDLPESDALPAAEHAGAAMDQEPSAVAHQTFDAADQAVADIEAEHIQPIGASSAAPRPREATAVGSASPAELEAAEPALQQEQRDLLGRIAAMQDRQVGLEEQLELQGVAVDFDQAQRELAELEDRLQVRKQAFRIVSLARRNIVGKVLPSTVRNMGLLLPLLTNDRYRDVEIDPETYKIKVWDEAARAMKAKDIFSGGTRDQFSLALRLAFALATLPEELGTAPGFIFLDEPLSSFDPARTSALVTLLTRGLVASNFEQIFVISHNRSFDQTLFDYHLQLDAGRIVASDLPASEDEPDGAGEQMALELTSVR